jgi:hypothetical protein
VIARHQLAVFGKAKSPRAQEVVVSNPFDAFAFVGRRIEGVAVPPQMVATICHSIWLPKLTDNGRLGLPFDRFVVDIACVPITIKVVRHEQPYAKKRSEHEIAERLENG